MSYYLRRSFTGEYSMSGAIFLDVRPVLSIRRAVCSFIHGHNMHNGTAFGKLSRFDDIDYLNKYPHIKFSTLYESAMYISPLRSSIIRSIRIPTIYLDIYRINSMTGSGIHCSLSIRCRRCPNTILPVNVCGNGQDFHGHNLRDRGCGYALCCVFAVRRAKQ